MSEQYDNTNRGVLFKNDRKESDKHPDYKGSINIDGREYWLSGWRKETKAGPTLSLSVQPKQQQRIDPQAPLSREGMRAELDDEIPFEMSWK